MSNSKVINKVEVVCTAIAEDLGFELVDIEFNKEGSSYFLRVYIHKSGGITIDDCQSMSQVLSNRLDEDDPISVPYYLEVSSPGLDRPLKTDKDLKRNLGNEIEIKLYQALKGKKIVEGILTEFTEDEIRIKTPTEEMVKIPKEAIAIIRLAVKF